MLRTIKILVSSLAVAVALAVLLALPAAAWILPTQGCGTKCNGLMLP